MRSPSLELVFAPLLVLGAAWVALVPDMVPRIACVFRWVTGLPCLACGSTRAVLLLAHGDVTGAFVMNPLTTVIAFLAVVYVIRAALVAFGVVRPLSIARKYMYVGGVLVAINWSYLLMVGR